MLLSMQNILDTQGNHIQDGLVPDDLKNNSNRNQKRDGVQIVKSN